ncbi:MAG: GtrA family protein [Clostridiaceae bacterium]
MINIIKFSGVGVLNTLITAIIYNCLIFFNVNYLLANAVGYAAGTINGYILNSKYVFNKKASVKTGIKFILVNILSFLVNSSVLWLFVHSFGVNKTLSQIPAIGFGFAVNFLVNKLWTFK